MPNKLTEKREELQAKQNKMEQVLKEAGEDYDFEQVESLGPNLDTQAKVEKFRELNKELADLTDECKALEELEGAHSETKKRRAMLNSPAPSPHPSPGGEGKASLGERFVESEAYTALKEHGVKGTPARYTGEEAELKTLFQTSAGWAPESTRIGRLVPDAERPPQVLDLIPMGNTNQAAIVYMEETTRSHAAAETAEAGSYPEAQFALTEQSSTVRKIGTSIPVTDEQLDDEAQVRSYLDNRLRFGVRQRLDAQVLTGNGSGSNLEGILNVTNVQTQAKSTDPRFDAIHKGLTKVRVTGRAVPNAVVMHSNDWEALRLTRTADGIYILGNPAQRGPRTVFGLPVVLSEGITENTALVGDYANFCQLFDRRQLEVRAGFVDQQFTKGQQTLRADIRAAFVVFRPEAFCMVTGL